MGRTKGSSNKVHDHAAADGEQNEEQDGADDADIEEPDLQQLVRTISRNVEQQGRDIFARISMLEQRHSACSSSAVALRDSTAAPQTRRVEPRAPHMRKASQAPQPHPTIAPFRTFGPLFDIVGDADPDYRHDPDTAHISTLWRRTIEHRKSSAAWTQEDLEVLNSSSLQARVTFAAIDALSQVPADANGRVDNALVGLYAAEEQLRRTFCRLQLRLLAPEKTANTVWRAALACHAQAQQRQSIHGMPFALPALAEIMAEVHKKSAEAALKDLLTNPKPPTGEGEDTA